MKITLNHKSTICTLMAAGCLGLLVCLQAFADPQVQQPNSISENPVQLEETVVAQDTEVTPTGCTDSCCGNGCCESGCCNGGCCNGKCCNGGNCCCEAVCCPKHVKEEVKKHYWCVKPELVCIPGFRFVCNWNRPKCCNSNCCDTCAGSDGCCGNGCCCDCIPPKCGRVRCINVLEKHEYTCEECGYEWEVKCVRTKNGCCCGKGGCKCPACGRKHNCCASTEAPASDVQLTSAQQETPSEAPVKKKESLSSLFTGWLRR